MNLFPAQALSKKVCRDVGRGFELSDTQMDLFHFQCRDVGSALDETFPAQVLSKIVCR